MELLSTPIPHINTSVGSNFYNYCKANWLSTAETNHELRYNVPITNKIIFKGLNTITEQAINILKPVLVKEYPKWSGLIVNKRYQFSGNLVASSEYKMRDWHLDNGNKAIIGLWYFKHPDDNTDAGLYISDGSYEQYIPYTENRLILLPNTVKSWHKVGKRKQWTHERRFINIVLETDTYLHNYARDGLIDTIKPVSNLML